MSPSFSSQLSAEKPPPEGLLSARPPLRQNAEEPAVLGDQDVGARVKGPERERERDEAEPSSAPDPEDEDEAADA